MSRSDDQLIDWIKSLNTDDELRPPVRDDRPSRRAASKVIELTREVSKQKYAVKRKQMERASASLEAARIDVASAMAKYGIVNSITGYYNVYQEFV
jgi:hypothetical protein